jgi:hypothetical protein
MEDEEEVENVGSRQSISSGNCEGIEAEAAHKIGEQRIVKLNKG